MSTDDTSTVEPVPAAPSFDLVAAVERIAETQDWSLQGHRGAAREELLAAYRAGLAAGQLAYMAVINGSRQRMSELMMEASAEVTRLGRSG